MRNTNLLLTAYLSLGTVSFRASCQSMEKPNILFITVDDMNDWTTVFNKNNPIKTQNICKQASRGTFFSKAYCTSPASNPSRASVMTGTHPRRTRIYGNNSDWKALPQIKTIQHHFNENDYFVCGSGKIYHHYKNWAFHDNAAFQDYLMLAINEPYPDKKIKCF